MSWWSSRPCTSELRWNSCTSSFWSKLVENNLAFFSLYTNSWNKGNNKWNIGYFNCPFIVTSSLKPFQVQVSLLAKNVLNCWNSQSLVREKQLRENNKKSSIWDFSLDVSITPLLSCFKKHHGCANVIWQGAGWREQGANFPSVKSCNYADAARSPRGANSLRLQATVPTFYELLSWFGGEWNCTIRPARTPPLQLPRRDQGVIVWWRGPVTAVLHEAQ